MFSRLLAFVFAASVAATGCGRLLPNKKGDTYEARARLARELVARQDWDGAFFYVDQLQRERPRDPEPLALRGVIFREKGMPEEAERDLKEAIQRDKRWAEAHAALGILYDSTARGQLGEGHHRRAVAIAPESVQYLNNLGFSLFLRKRYQDAIEVYRRAARLAPADRRVRTNLGFAYASAGDFPRAAREFSMGAAPAEAKNNLGFAYEQRGDLSRAFELYLEALRLNPKSERARANLHHLSRKLGRPLPADVSDGPAPVTHEERKP